jgi:hypothetical protein
VNKPRLPRSLRLALAAAILSASAAIASAANYVLPPDRITQWTPGLMTRGGIPSASWPVCNATSLTPSGGDDSQQINNMIASCPPRSVVQLGPGRFILGRGQYIAITRGLVLRGAGAGVTTLVNPLNKPATAANQAPADPTPVVIICPGRWVNPDGDARCQGPTAFDAAFMRRLSVNGVKGSSSVTIANASIFRAGQYVLLDETSGAGWRANALDPSQQI